MKEDLTHRLIEGLRNRTLDAAIIALPYVAQDIDTAVVAGLSHPMGPLRLSDLIGLDTMKLIADSMYDEYKDPHYAPPPLLQRMVEAGQLGKKSGKGFYTY